MERTVELGVKPQTPVNSIEPCLALRRHGRHAPTSGVFIGLRGHWVMPLWTKKNQLILARYMKE